MQRAVLFSLATVLLAFVAETSAQRFHQPTYRPPPPPPKTYRFRRDADEPLWLNQDDNNDRAPATGDHPYLPPVIDDIHLDPNTRYARSIRFDPISPLPSPTFPKPLDPFNPEPFSNPSRRFPIYARTKRDIQFPQKPKHYDIVLTGWNPNARVQPWQKIRVRA